MENEDRIREIIQEELRKTGGVVPHHVHNGIDSPNIDYDDLINVTEFTDIAFDSTTAYGLSGSSQNNNYTVTGANPLLFVAIALKTPDTISAAPTYDSVSMTLIDSTTISAVGWTCYLYYLRSPNPGTNTLATTTSSLGTTGLMIATSYTNTNQSSQPDITAKSGPTTTTNYTQSVTTATSNAWVIMVGIADSNLAITADNGTVVRTVLQRLYFCDSGVRQPSSGAYTLGVSSASQAFTGIICSFKPVP